MEEDVKAFLDYLSKEKKYSQNTLAAYNSDLTQLVVFVKAKNTDGAISSWVRLSTDILTDYVLNLKERKYRSATIARKVAAVKAFLKFMADRGKLRNDLSPGLVSPQVNKAAPKSLSVSEVRRVIAEAAKRSSIEAKRDRAMLELLYATGLRASELMSLNEEDIDLKAKHVRCRARNSKARVIPIDGQIAQVIKEYRDNTRPMLLRDEKETAFFLNARGERLTRQGFWQIVRGYAAKAGLAVEVTPRKLRHSFAAHKLSSGADLQSVQELLGHAHLSTTGVYRQVKPHS